MSAELMGPIDEAARMKQIRKQIEKALANDVISYIEGYCHIEDKTSLTEPIVPFKLWPEQKKALRSLIIHRLNAIIKARQIGMTWLVLSYASHQLQFIPGFTSIGLSKTEDDAKELVRRLGSVILARMPALIQRYGKQARGWEGRTFEQFSERIVIHHPDGEPDSVFTALPAGENSGRSLTTNLLLLDEWAFQEWARQIWKAVFPTINRPTGGKLIGLSTIERGTLFEDIFSTDQYPDFNKIFIPWYADPSRDQAWYDKTKAALHDDIMQEYPATLEEALTIPGGCYFPEVKGHTHLKPVLEEIPENYRRYVCLDYGGDMFAVHWLWVDERGNARVYRELNQKGLTISEAAELLLEKNGEDVIDLWLAPPDLWNARQETGRSAADIFSECGVELTKTSNNRANGGRAMKDWFRPLKVMDEETGEIRTVSKLTIDELSCPNLWRCLTQIQKHRFKKDEYEDKIKHELTHNVDALRCFCVYWTQDGTPKPEDRPKVYWTEDMYEDYYRARDDGKEYLLKKYGNPFV